jgi:hypothetical protein
VVISPAATTENAPSTYVRATGRSLRISAGVRAYRDSIFLPELLLCTSATVLAVACLHAMALFMLFSWACWYGRPWLGMRAAGAGVPSASSLYSSSLLLVGMVPLLGLV